MTADPKRVKEIFLDAVEKATPAERAAFLDAACAGDLDLRRRVEALLEAHDEPGRLPGESAVPAAVEAILQAHAMPDHLPDPPTGNEGTTGPYHPPPPSAQQLELDSLFAGRYKIRQKLGQGGMGVVYVADQTEPVQRRVALKLIKTDLPSEEMRARFEQERQALALMDHPNIARVFDAGIADGLPYFVMELVNGLPLTQYCDDARLTPKQRLELFIPVCQAVQHAHQKGVIHRDLKPSNILVGLYDGRPVPKVIDFGVAKATGPRLNEHSVYTEIGAMVGTLEYMAPEQAEVNNLDIDTRSDIYALGVILYQLLTGTVPFTRQELQAAGLVEMLRIIKEVEPPKPSARLSESGNLPGVAVARQTEPARLSRLVRGELDWIVMKCLEKDRARRYETANSLALDLQRYLCDEPVLAGPPSAGYRLRKFVKRNKGQVVAAGLVLLALVAGIAGTTWGLIRAEQARQDAVSAQVAESQRADGERLAKEEERKAKTEAQESAVKERKAKEESQKRLAQIEKGTEILASVFYNLDPKTEQKEGATLRVLLGRRLGEAVKQLEGEAVGDPLVVARLQAFLGTSLQALGHLEQGEAVLVKAHQTRERLLGADHPDTLASKRNLARLYQA